MPCDRPTMTVWRCSNARFFKPQSTRQDLRESGPALVICTARTCPRYRTKSAPCGETDARADGIHERFEKTITSCFVTFRSRRCAPRRSSPFTDLGAGTSRNLSGPLKCSAGLQFHFQPDLIFMRQIPDGAHPRPVYRSIISSSLFVAREASFQMSSIAPSNDVSRFTRHIDCRNPPPAVPGTHVFVPIAHPSQHLVENPVYKLRRFLIAELFRQFDRFIQRDLAGTSGTCKQLKTAQAQNVPVDDRASGRPSIGRIQADQRINSFT